MMVGGVGGGGAGARLTEDKTSIWRSSAGWRGLCCVADTLSLLDTLVAFI